MTNPKQPSDIGMAFASVSSPLGFFRSGTGFCSTPAEHSSFPTAFQDNDNGYEQSRQRIAPRKRPPGFPRRPCHAGGGEVLECETGLDGLLTLDHCEDRTAFEGGGMSEAGMTDEEILEMVRGLIELHAPEADREAALDWLARRVAFYDAGLSQGLVPPDDL